LTSVSGSSNEKALDVRPMTTLPADTILRFFRHLDEQNYDSIPDLFDEGGIWHRRDRALHGPAEVKQSLIELPPVMPTVHLVTNLQVEESAPDEAQAVFYVTALRPVDAVSEPPPWPMDAPLVVTRYSAHLMHRQGTWRFKTLKNSALFKR
jgi:hypothetical protein